MSQAEQAVATYQQGFNCAQSVFATLGPGFGLSREQCLRAAAAMGGGIGQSGETCGAVAGALMALGLRDGFTEPDAAAKQRVYARAQEYMRRFTERCGALRCRELLGVDISTPEGSQQARERCLSRTICDDLVRAAVEIFEQMETSAG